MSILVHITHNTILNTNINVHAYLKHISITQKLKIHEKNQLKHTKKLQNSGKTKTKTQLFNTKTQN